MEGTSFWTTLSSYPLCRIWSIVVVPSVWSGIHLCPMSRLPKGRGHHLLSIIPLSISSSSSSCFSSSILSRYYSSSFVPVFLFLLLPTIITSNRNITKREPNERSRWTMRMVYISFFDSFDMMWHLSHFYHKVNRLSWHREGWLAKKFLRCLLLKILLTKSHIRLCSEEDVVVIIVRLLDSNRRLYERTKEINLSLIIASPHRPRARWCIIH